MDALNDREEKTIPSRLLRKFNRKEKMINKKGVASIRIEYDQGDIKVFHGDHDVVLASWKEPDDVNDHWDDLWEYLNYMAVKYKGYRVGGVQ